MPTRLLGPGRHSPAGAPPASEVCWGWDSNQGCLPEDRWRSEGGAASSSTWLRPLGPAGAEYQPSQHPPQQHQHQQQRWQWQQDEEEEEDEETEEPGSGEVSLLSAPGNPPPWLTTLLVRRLPVRVTQEALLEKWPHPGSYNFLFLPYSAKQRRASRYVFVNFVSSAAAKAFYERWHGQLLPGFQEDILPLDVSEAKLQGLAPNLWHHRSVGSDQRRHQPAVFVDGRREHLTNLLARMAQRTPSAHEMYWQGRLKDLVARWEAEGNPPLPTRGPPAGEVHHL